MTEKRVERAEWVEIAPFVALAGKEHVNVTDIRGAVWFKITGAKGRVLAFAGVAPVGKRKIRIRAGWTRHDFRGHGYGDQLMQACLQYGIAARFEEVEILSWDKRWALRNGFVEKGRNQHGAYRLIYSVNAPVGAEN